MRGDGVSRSGFNARANIGGPRGRNSMSGGMRSNNGRYYNPPPMLMQQGPSMPYMMPHPMHMNYQPGQLCNSYGYGAQMSPYWNYPPMMQNQMPVHHTQPAPTRTPLPRRSVATPNRIPRDRRPTAEPRISIGSSVHPGSSAVIASAYGQARTLSEALDEVYQSQAMDQHQQGFIEPLQPLQDPRLKSPNYRKVLPAATIAGQISEEAKGLALVQLPDAVPAEDAKISSEDRNQVAKHLLKNPLFGHQDPFQLVQNVVRKTEEKFVPKERSRKRARSSSPSMLENDAEPMDDSVCPVFKKPNLLETIVQVVPNDVFVSKPENTVIPTECIELTDDEDKDEVMIVEEVENRDLVTKETVRWFVDRDPSNFYVTVGEDSIEDTSRIVEVVDEQSNLEEAEHVEIDSYIPPMGKNLPPLSNFSAGVSELEFKQTVVNESAFLKIRQSIQKFRGKGVDNGKQ